MRMMHPTLPAGQFADTDEETFDRVWEPRGWQAAPELGDISVLSVDEVLEVVDGDPVKAAVAIAEETAGRARTTLLKRLAPITKSADTGTEES